MAPAIERVATEGRAGTGSLGRPRNMSSAARTDQLDRDAWKLGADRRITVDQARKAALAERKP